MITGNLKVDLIILRHTTTTTATTQKLNPRSDASSAAQTILTTNHRQLTSASQAVSPPGIKLCLTFVSRSISHYKNSPLCRLLCSLIDGTHFTTQLVTLSYLSFKWLKFDRSIPLWNISIDLNQLVASGVGYFVDHWQSLIPHKT
uniref:Transmembrane protein n=1 Tax=Mesocestoides corti TaxID=53468 RepID=A0A5K3FV69_MESCO